MRRRQPVTRSAAQFVVRVDGMPVGVGSNRQPSTRLDGVLAGALMGMQTVKSVEIGLGAELRRQPGSQAHDTFAMDGQRVVRASNRAGGIEGGMSNGEAIVVRVSVKPIPTLSNALASVNLHEQRKRRRRSCAATCASFRRRRNRRRSDGADRADGSGSGKVRRRFAWRRRWTTCAQPRGGGRTLSREPERREAPRRAARLHGGREDDHRASKLARKLQCAFFDTDALVVGAHGADVGYIRHRRRGRVSALRIGRAGRDPGRRRRRGVVGRRRAESRREPATS